jgi:hypothetical protein
MFSPCFGIEKNGERTMQLDHKRLTEARTKTTLSGQYVLVWNQVMQYMREHDYSIDLNDYLITFDEDNENFIVYFTKPVKQPTLGGGSAKAIVRKKDMHIYDFKFSR